MGAGVKRIPDVSHRRALRCDDASALFSAGAVPVAAADKERPP
jgi:hypothetical protein